MLDIKFVRENPEIVKQNIKNKFQDKKLPLVDEVIELDDQNRKIKKEVESLRAERIVYQRRLVELMKEGKKEEAEEIKAKLLPEMIRLMNLQQKKREQQKKLRREWWLFNNYWSSVPIGKMIAKCWVERFGEPVVPDFEVPYHTEIMEKFNGIDLEAARNVAGNGFYYLMGDIARLHSAVLSYARDFMIDRGFTYCVPPFYD